MESVKPHAVCIPLPAQGHINPMLKFAKLLHYKGFHITFVHTDFNYHRLVKSRALDSLKGLDDFRNETISDGLPSTKQRGILDLPALCTTMQVHGLRSLHDLITKINASSVVPPVSCIVSDGVMGFTLKAAQEFGIPEVMLFTPSGLWYFGLSSL
uniref:Glycosyltransferase N-terminal domain-containing protein n=1 Tax=Fagus sylvatica TaxID=28930 RepID=A0A2N9HGL3_FAGSY